METIPLESPTVSNQLISLASREWNQSFRELVIPTVSNQLISLASREKPSLLLKHQQR